MISNTINNKRKNMEPVQPLKPTPESKARGERFVDITTEIAEVSKQYSEISENTSQLFIESLLSFVELHRLMNDNPEVDLTNQNIKMAMFESMFDFSFEDAVKQLIESRISSNGFDNGENQESPEDINTIDKDLLKNIKENINEYLKD